MEGRRAVGAATIAEAFRLTVEDHPDRIAVRTLDDETALTWAQLRDRSDALAGTLHGLGVRRGDTVALMISNRPEFQIADQAASHGIGEDEVVEKIMLARAAIKRLIEPAEVAELVAYLCSPPAAFITGASIALDGGWTAN